MDAMFAGMEEDDYEELQRIFKDYKAGVYIFLKKIVTPPHPPITRPLKKKVTPSYLL